MDGTEEPTIGGEDEVAERLDKAPLPVHSTHLKILREAAGSLSRPGPEAFEHRPRVAEALDVGSAKFPPLGEAIIEFRLDKRLDVDGTPRLATQASLTPSSWLAGW